MTTLDLLTIATTLAGLFAAFLRLANAWRPLWAWLPVPAQLALPAVLVAIGQAQALLADTPTAESLVRAAALVVGALLVAWRGNPPAPPNARATRPSLPVLAALALLACTSTPTRPVAWPPAADLANCAPPTEALAELALDLLADGPPTLATLAELEEFARDEGPGAALCALRAVADGKLPGVTAEQRAAAAGLLELVERIRPAAAPAAEPSSLGSPGAAGGAST